MSPKWKGREKEYYAEYMRDYRQDKKKKLEHELRDLRWKSRLLKSIMKKMGKKHQEIMKETIASPEVQTSWAIMKYAFDSYEGGQFKN